MIPVISQNSAISQYCLAVYGNKRARRREFLRFTYKCAVQSLVPDEPAVSSSDKQDAVLRSVYLQYTDIHHDLGRICQALTQPYHP